LHGNIQGEFLEDGRVVGYHLSAAEPASS
jgi:hypothetical protein